MAERKSILIKLFSSHLVLLPVLLIITLVFKQIGGALLLIDQTLLVLLFWAGYWEFFGIRFKRMFLILCQISILLLFIGRMFSTEVLHPNNITITIIAIAELYLLSMMARIVIVILKRDKENVEINFPFGQGTYLISDGGNSKTSRLMNYHFHSPIHKKKKTNLSMLYATDIVKLSNTKTKLLPVENESYPVFSETLLCPMDGLVIKVVNNIEDNIPYSGNYPYNTGNTVVIKKDHYYLLLGHLKKGSIGVNVGDQVNRNDRLGEAGNSGMSERPHLHMQLIKCDCTDYWQGLGINIRYQGKNLYKNRLIRL